MEEIRPQALTVTEITQYIKNRLEDDEFLQSIFVKGEISNFKRHRFRTSLFYIKR